MKVFMLLACVALSGLVLVVERSSAAATASKESEKWTLDAMREYVVKWKTMQLDVRNAAIDAESLQSPPLLALELVLAFEAPLDKMVFVTEDQLSFPEKLNETNNRKRITEAFAEATAQGESHMQKAWQMLQGMSDELKAKPKYQELVKSFTKFSDWYFDMYLKLRGGAPILNPKLYIP